MNKKYLITISAVGLSLGFMLATPQRLSGRVLDQPLINEPLLIETTNSVVLTATVTAYSCGGLTTEAEIRMNCPSLLTGSPKTATGSEPIPYRTVACDREYLYQAFELEGIGRVVCTDTGGAIKGSGRFDLYVENVQEAREWGLREITYTQANY